MRAIYRELRFVCAAVVAIVVSLVGASSSLPSRTALERAMPSVKEVMADEWREMEAGRKKAVDVAAASMSRARKAKSDAERFMLMKGAVDLNARTGEFERAAEALAAMRSEFPDIAEEVARGIVAAAAGADHAAEVVARSIALRRAWDFPKDFRPPLLRTLRISKDVEIEFAAIPSGTFGMSDAGGRTSHKVTITRPFWITRSYVTDRQLCSMSPSRERNERAERCEKLFPDMDVASFRIFPADYEKICVAMNDRFSGCIPEGYVFRLPTEAEFEYAVRQGDGEGVLTRVELLSNRLGADKDCPVGGVRLLPRNKTNEWGILVGFVESAHVMDGVNLPEGIERTFRRGMTAKSDIVNAAAKYSDGEIDPVRHGGWRITRMESNRRILNHGHWGLARIVIAPKSLNEYPRR